VNFGELTVGRSRAATVFCAYDRNCAQSVVSDYEHEQEQEQE